MTPEDREFRQRCDAARDAYLLALAKMDADAMIAAREAQMRADRAAFRPIHYVREVVDGVARTVARFGPRGTR